MMDMGSVSGLGKKNSPEAAMRVMTLADRSWIMRHKVAMMRLASRRGEGYYDAPGAAPERLWMRRGIV